MSARTKRQRQARALRRRVERAEARVAVLEAAKRERKKPAERQDDPSSSVASTSPDASTTSRSVAAEEAPEGARVAGSGGPATPDQLCARSGETTLRESATDLGPLALLREYRSEIFGAVLPPLLVLLIFAIPLVVGIFLGWWAS
ncbi:hypothetical protein ABFU82_22395 [Nocardioides sp. WV_118_6]